MRFDKLTESELSHVKEVFETTFNSLISQPLTRQQRCVAMEQVCTHFVKATIAKSLEKGKVYQEGETDELHSFFQDKVKVWHEEFEKKHEKSV